MIEHAQVEVTPCGIVPDRVRAQRVAEATQPDLRRQQISDPQANVLTGNPIEIPQGLAHDPNAAHPTADELDL